MQSNYTLSERQTGLFSVATGKLSRTAAVDKVGVPAITLRRDAERLCSIEYGFPASAVLTKNEFLQYCRQPHNLNLVLEAIRVMPVQKSGRPKTLPEGDKYKFQSLWDLKKDAGAGVSARGMKYQVGEYFKSQ